MKAKALLMILPPLSPRSPNGKIWCCQCSGFLLFLVAGLTVLTYLVPQGWPGTNGTSFPRTAVGRVSCMSVWAGRVRRNSNILGSGGARWCHMAFDIFGSYALLYHTMGVSGHVESTCCDHCYLRKLRKKPQITRYTIDWAPSSIATWCPKRMVMWAQSQLS